MRGVCEMRKVLFAVVALYIFTAAVAFAAPSVTNVQATQLKDGTGTVTITYDVSAPGKEWVYVTVAISTDGGSTYSITPATVTGNIGFVRPGKARRITWDAKADHPDAKWTSCKARITVDDSAGVPGQMVYIPAGSFLMGSPDGVGHSDERPQHWVYLSGYSIGKYEVTRGEYARFIAAGGYSDPDWWSTAGWNWRVSNNRTEPRYWAAVQNWESPPGSFTQTDRHPVVGVTYYEAEAYCKWAGGRLPTEAEWEKAARWHAGTQHPRVYPWGDIWDAQKCNNWHDSLYPGYQTSPVGSYPAGMSPYGLHDMAGNVWEWVHDWYKSYPGSTSPFDYTGSYRVLRGGGWGSPGSGCRSAYRDSYNPDHGWSSLGGFRLAR
jgi:formylglycine-generating enzyme required for sulfatase activity